MKRYVIKPDGWPCTLAACPPGPFVWQDSLCFKSEYRTPEGKIEAFCDSGEFFYGGAPTEEARGALLVQPVMLIIEEVEE